MDPRFANIDPDTPGSYSPVAHTEGQMYYNAPPQQQYNAAPHHHQQQPTAAGYYQQSLPSSSYAHPPQQRPIPSHDERKGKNPKIAWDEKGMSLWYTISSPVGSAVLAFVVVFLILLSLRPSFVLKPKTITVEEERGGSLLDKSEYRARFEEETFYIVSWFRIILISFASAFLVGFTKPVYDHLSKSDKK